MGDEKDKGGKTLLMLGTLGALAYFLLKKPTAAPTPPTTITPPPITIPTPQPTPQPQPLPCCEITPTQPQPQPQPITTPTTTITPQPTAPAPTPQQQPAPQPQPQPVPQPQPAPAPETTTIVLFINDPQSKLYNEGIATPYSEIWDITPTPTWVSSNAFTIPNGTQVTIKAKPISTYAGNVYTCKQLKIYDAIGNLVASGADSVTLTAIGGRYDVYAQYY